MALLSRTNVYFVLKVVTVFLACSVVLDMAFYSTSTARNADLGEESNASIAKVSMLYGEPNPLYERALATHEAHNNKFGYPFFILRERTLPGYWSKPAYLLRLLLSELEKPEANRLKWLMWVDGDVVVMNPNIPLEIFLPPEADWDHIHAVMTNDHRGLNNGVFFLKVHEWSVWLMNSCLNTQIHVPDLQLEFGDQSALQYWFNKELFRNNTIHVPQRWFNAYAGYRGAPTDLFADPLQPSYKFKENSVKEGDLFVHHAGHKSLRAQRMLPWIEVAESHLESWQLELEATTYLEEIADFWKNDARNERKAVDKVQKVLEENLRKKQAAKDTGAKSAVGQDGKKQA
ncbi:hypothetical protein LTS08_004333 [Lithohypha guttulata]|uniref:uncharacterized protein n=1 Tax=Lithohypha guttulata TaxID=1690604 RepID=UPI002DE17D24|nr:hypothetical protein LTR51_005889 [Lithohypha guttulata]KAK5101874.1 hypothetical protein LTS08_004333 [Lithohypha guttulata]